MAYTGLKERKIAYFREQKSERQSKRESKREGKRERETFVIIKLRE